MTTLTPAKKKEVSEKKRLASQNNINKAREKRLGDKKRQKELREMYGISTDDEEEVSEEEGTDLEEEESVIFKAVQKKPQTSEVEALRKEIEMLKATKIVRKPRQKKVVYVEPVVEEEPTPEPVKVKEVKEPVKEPTKEPTPTPTPEPPKVKSKIQQLTIEERVNRILGCSVGKK